MSKEIAKIKASNSPTTVKEMARWLRECLYLITDDETNRFTRVVCHQLLKGNKRGEEVFSLNVPKKADDDWTENAAFEIYSKLKIETATLGGLQKYSLYAYHSATNESHTSRFVLRIEGISDDEDDDSLNSENPDKAGLVSQNMRHTEAMAKIVAAMIPTMVTGYQSMIARQASMLDRQSSMIEKLLEDKVEGIETMRALTSDAEERDIKLIQARAKAKGVEKLVDRLGLLLPAAVNKIAGKAILPDKDPALMMMTKGLFTSIATDEKKLQALSAILEPEQSVAFMNILEELSTKTDDNGMPLKKKEES